MKIVSTEQMVKKLRSENAFLRKELARLRKKDAGVVWRPIPGFERYEASSEGNIRRAADMHGRPAGNVLKPKVCTWGHEAVSIYGETRDNTYHSSVHRLVCMAFHGPAPFEGAVACHNNGDATDNRPENLRWGTVQENADDEKRHRLMRMQTMMDGEMTLAEYRCKTRAIALAKKKFFDKDAEETKACA